MSENTDREIFLESTVREIRNAAKEVYAMIGSDQDDFVCEACLCKELHKRGMSFVRVKAMPFLYRGERIDDIHVRPSLIVEDIVFVEVDSMSMPHQFEERIQAVFNYSKKTTALFINFRVSSAEQIFKRVDMPKIKI